MLDKTLGYILCCQSPALFLAALALLVAYLAGRKHKVRAFFRLLLCILCAAGGVALYFLGIYKEYFTIRDFFPDPHCGLDRPGHRGILLCCWRWCGRSLPPPTPAASRRPPSARKTSAWPVRPRRPLKPRRRNRPRKSLLRPRLPRRSRYPRRFRNPLPFPPSRLRCQKMSSRRAKLTIIQIMVNPSAAQKCGRWVFCKQKQGSRETDDLSPGSLPVARGLYLAPPTLFYGSTL